ncbi:hypothetical protein P7K49_007271 [Saguinus oedipus]|uniref:GMP reductase n=1 Tax=Saguinus oedipus TaxID=9490 RepID=A0ABQ9VUY5_SAGOE|nr:hypothetical protein P7K49_007271 [Saguinus oedipus]
MAKKLSALPAAIVSIRGPAHVSSLPECKRSFDGFQPRDHDLKGACCWRECHQAGWFVSPSSSAAHQDFAVPSVQGCSREPVPFGASEGKTVEVPYKGDVENTILDILGGLRSTCTYVGAAKLKELSRRATFIRVTQQHNTVFS